LGEIADKYYEDCVYLLFIISFGWLHE